MAEIVVAQWARVLAILAMISCAKGEKRMEFVK